MVDAIDRVSSKEGEPVTRTRTNLVAPSPSRTTSCESFWVKSMSVLLMASKSFASFLLMVLPPAAPLARNKRVSLVLVDPSTDIALKDRSVV